MTSLIGPWPAGIRLLVCGARVFRERAPIERAIVAVRPALLIHGAANGADALAAEVARDLAIPVTAFPADWAGEGAAAGPLRNTRMLLEGKPDLVLAFPRGTSVGTTDMVRQSLRRQTPTAVYSEGQWFLRGPGSVPLGDRELAYAITRLLAAFGQGGRR